jgi:hypothetical protein
MEDIYESKAILKDRRNMGCYVGFCSGACMFDGLSVGDSFYDEGGIYV